MSLLARHAGIATTLAQVTKRSGVEQIAILRHIDFSGQEPDEIFAGLLEVRQDEEFLKDANVRFMYPGAVVSGSYSHYLIERRALLVSWAKTHGSGAVRKWADALVPALDKWIERESRMEAEGAY